MVTRDRNCKRKVVGKNNEKREEFGLIMNKGIPDRE